jgi:hypothetical protein
MTPVCSLVLSSLVVQHKTDRWRGVITGWQRKEETGNKLSSLTNKDYEKNQDIPAVMDNDQNADIQYTVLLDSGDAHFLGGERRFKNVAVAMQSDLDEVKDNR